MARGIGVKMAGVASRALQILGAEERVFEWQVRIRSTESGINGWKRSNREGAGSALELVGKEFLGSVDYLKQVRQAINIEVRARLSPVELWEFINYLVDIIKGLTPRRRCPTIVARAPMH